MAHLLRQLFPGGGMAFMALGKDHDVVTTAGYEKLQEKPTGWEGVRKMFSKDKYGEINPYLTTIVHMSSLGLLGGVIVGSFLNGRKAYLDFMENNHATMFVSHFEAQRKLRDTIIVQMGKGAAKWGYRIGVFSFLFISTNMIMTAYIGESSIISYTTAGVCAGSLFKANLGPKGMVSGAIAGALCGTMGGLASMGILKLSGMNMDDIAKFQQQFRESRKRAGDEALRKEFIDEQDKILMNMEAVTEGMKNQSDL